MSQSNSAVNSLSSRVSSFFSSFSAPKSSTVVRSSSSSQPSFLTTRVGLTPGQIRGLQIIGGLVVLRAVASFTWRYAQRRKRRARDLRHNEPDLVYLYQFPVPREWNFTPSQSMFCLKLQAYLQLAKIPYQIVPTTMVDESTGKAPYIRLNGVNVNDSSFCIDYLNSQLGIDMDSHLSVAERGQSRAFTKLIEESLRWAVMWGRWFPNPEIANYCARCMLGVPDWASPIGAYFWRKMLKRDMHGHGMGRLNGEQIMTIAFKDLDAIAAQLGDKNYMFGNDRPSTVDCITLAMISSIMDVPILSAEREHIENNLPHLVVYLERVRVAIFGADGWQTQIEAAQNNKME